MRAADPAARRIAVALLSALLASSIPQPARAVSITIDFDRTGHGQVFRAGEVATPGCGRCNDSYAVATRTRAERDPAVVQRQMAEMQAFEERRRRLQEEEARQRLEAARIAADLADRQDRLGRLNGVWEGYLKLGDDDRDTSTQIRVLDLMPRFQDEQLREKDLYAATLEGLIAEVRRANGPPPQRCDSVLLLGVGADADVAAQDGALPNPFTGVPFGSRCSFGFARGTQWLDLVARGIPDHLLHSVARLSPITRTNLARFPSVMTTSSLVVHSNGLMVAEALIRAHRIQGLKELRILGGDAVLMHLEDLQRLADANGIKVKIYAIKSDPVPLTPTGWLLRRYSESLLTQVISYNTNRNLAYAVLGLYRHVADPAANLQIELMDCPEQWDLLKRHDYLSYRAILNGQRMMNCLDGGTDQRCRISY
ncbi:MAG TPA: hypothetical protein VGX96_00675 [Candidatus Elarobacter sp.]|nr:hypothetical protein [Candidatus Elarobacter sp.]